MKSNVGKIDKAIRILLALGIASLYYFDQISGLTATALLILAGIFIITSFLSFCPLYLPFGISTNNKK